MFLCPKLPKKSEFLVGLNERERERERERKKKKEGVNNVYS